MKGLEKYTMNPDDFILWLLVAAAVVLLLLGAMGLSGVIDFSGLV